jgi:hypothetical protein
MGFELDLYSPYEYQFVYVQIQHLLRNTHMNKNSLDVDAITKQIDEFELTGRIVEHNVYFKDYFQYLHFLELMSEHSFMVCNYSNFS